MKKLFAVVFAIITMTACSAKWHLKKAISKDPTLVQTREVIIRDTFMIRIPERSIDTFIVVEPYIHTTLEQDGVRVSLSTDTAKPEILNVVAECLTDTIEIFTEIQADCPPVVEYVHPHTTWGSRATWALVGAVLCLFLVKRI